MSVRNYVGFVAEFSIERIDEASPGEGLARFVTENLQKSGLLTKKPDDNGWAWEFATTKDGLIVCSIVGLVGDMETDPPRQWLITNECDTGFFGRIFGGKALVAKRDAFLREVCEALHQIMAADSRFSHIQWHQKDTFDQPHDQPGPTP